MPVPNKVIIPLQDIPEDSYQVFVSVGDKVKNRTGDRNHWENFWCIIRACNSFQVKWFAVGEMFHPLVQHVASVEIKSDGLDICEVHQNFNDSKITDPFEFLRKMGVSAWL